MNARVPEPELSAPRRPSNEPFDRAAAAAGVLLVIMIVPAVALYPNLQEPYGQEQVRAGYIDHAASTAISVGLYLFSFIPFTVFLIALWRRLRPAGEPLAMAALLGGIVFLTVLILWQAVLAGLLLQANFVDPDVELRPILAIVTMIDQSITLPLSVMSGAAGMAILSGRTLPRWLGWLGLLVAVLGLLGVLAIPAAFTLEAVSSVVGIGNPLALLLWLVWIIGVSIAFTRSRNPAM